LSSLTKPKMSKEQPTPQELDAILQAMHGAYGVDIPDWYEPGMSKPELTKFAESVATD
jgi:hypothetical protein